MEASINYPSTFPCPLHEGHETNHVSPLLRSELQTGRVRQRRAYTSVPSIISVSWIMESDIAAVFEIWFRDALVDGAEWFNMDICTPAGKLPCVCRFAGMYSGPKLVGRDHWKFEADLETFERAILAENWGIVPDFLLHRDVFDIAMNREWPV